MKVKYENSYKKSWSCSYTSQLVLFCLAASVYHSQSLYFIVSHFGQNNCAQVVLVGYTILKYPTTLLKIVPSCEHKLFGCTQHSLNTQQVALWHKFYVLSHSYCLQVVGYTQHFLDTQQVALEHNLYLHVAMK